MDIDRLEHWAAVNGTKLNKSKCQILHLGQSNAGHKYELGEQRLESSPAEKDLGVLIGSRLNASQQRALAARRANRMLGRIKQHNHLVKRGDYPTVFSNGASPVCSSGPHILRSTLRYLNLSRGGQSTW